MRITIECWLIIVSMATGLCIVLVISGNIAVGEDGTAALDFELSQGKSPTPFPTTSPIATTIQTPACDSPCMVTGKVMDIVTKKGVENTIIIDREGLEISSTHTDGTYYWDDFSQLPCSGGIKTFTASAYGYIPQSREVTVENCVEATLNFELTPSKIPRPIILVAPGRLTLYTVVIPSGEVTVMVLGRSGLLTGKMVKAEINKKGKRFISVTPTRQITDENGEASTLSTLFVTVWEYPKEV